MTNATRQEAHHPEGQGRSDERRGRRGKALRIPVTAMIDVTFLLLLYFILTAQFREDEGQLPGSLPMMKGPPPPTIPVRITIRPAGEEGDGAVYVGSRSPLPMTTPQELFRFLQSKQQEKSPSVILDVHGGVRWKYAVEAFNQALRAKYDKVLFAP